MNTGATIRVSVLIGAIGTAFTMAAFLLAAWGVYRVDKVERMDDETKTQIQREVEERIKAEMDARYVTQRELDGVFNRLDAIERAGR